LESPATATDLEAAKRAVLAREPGYARKYGSLKGDLSTQADLEGAGWWAAHKEAPFKSIRLWAVVVGSDVRPGEGTVHTWDVIQASPGSAWTVLLESDSSD